MLWPVGAENCIRDIDLDFDIYTRPVVWMAAQDQAEEQRGAVTRGQPPITQEEEEGSQKWIITSLPQSLHQRRCPHFAYKFEPHLLLNNPNTVSKVLRTSPAAADSISTDITHPSTYLNCLDVESRRTLELSLKPSKSSAFKVRTLLTFIGLGKNCMIYPPTL
ncbi:uncharacterized protein LOC144675951 [Cetorhinus maximus]